jgi:hypothetical protein
VESDNNYVQRDQSCAWRMIDGSVLIVKVKEAGGSRVFTFNKTGTAIWEFADGQHTESDIAAYLKDRFNLHDQTDVAADVHNFTANLVSRGLVEVAPSPFSEKVINV